MSDKPVQMPHPFETISEITESNIAVLYTALDPIVWANVKAVEVVAISSQVIGGVWFAPSFSIGPAANRIQFNAPEFLSSHNFEAGILGKLRIVQ